LPPRQAESELVGEWLRFDESGPLVQPVMMTTITIERPIPNAGKKRAYLGFTVFIVLAQASLILFAGDFRDNDTP